MTLADPGSTARTTVKRIPDRAVRDRRIAYEILDAARLAHVAVVIDGTPFVMPVAAARDGDHLLFHGSPASRLFRALSAGLPCCATVTLVDGLVVARSAFESSMNYRCVMVFGQASALEGSAKSRALDVITEHLMPGRGRDARASTDQELKATSVVSLPLNEISVKVRDGGADESAQDRGLPIWAGVLPIHTAYGSPLTDADVPAGTSVPDYIQTWHP